jgi:hypothetical protein
MSKNDACPTTPQERLNRSYTERTIAAVLAAKMAIIAGFNAGVGTDTNEDWDDEWRVGLAAPTSW